MPPASRAASSVTTKRAAIEMNARKRMGGKATGGEAAALRDYPGAGGLTRGRCAGRQVVQASTGSPAAAAARSSGVLEAARGSVATATSPRRAIVAAFEVSTAPGADGHGVRTTAATV